MKEETRQKEKRKRERKRGSEREGMRSKTRRYREEITAISSTGLID